MDLDITEVVSAIEYLSALDKEYQELDEGFLTKIECSTLNSLMKLPLIKWNESFVIKALTLLHPYHEELESLDLDFSLLDNTIDMAKLSFNGTHLVFTDVNDSIQQAIGAPLNITENSYYYEPSDVDFSKIIKINQDKKVCFDKNVLKYVNMQFNLHNINIESLFNNKNGNIKKDPMDFQKYGIGFGLMNKKFILADDMGLGKSLQSLLIAEYSDSYPCLIVCPSSLKLNWRKEIYETLGKKATILTSNKNIEPNDFYIINYESLHNYTDFIAKLNIKFMIFDESHFIKNYKAKRTKTCLEVSKQAEYIVAITGTPILNRPHELVTQLDLIGKLDDLGGYWGYSQEYCNSQEKNWGWDNSGSSNLQKLSSKLRESCLIRREKTEVLHDLPPKQRSIIPVEIVNMKEYQSKLREYNKTPKSDRQKRAELFHQCNLLSAEGKLHELKCFVEDFILSDEKVIIFAKHKAVLSKLLDMFPDAARIIQEDDVCERFKNSTEFQSNKNTKIIICSISIANAGFDLFAASNVIFAEFDYVDEINNQCEDRACRIGQVNAVNSWYLVADGTNDERILTITQDKEKITNEIKTGFKNDLIDNF